ncbi:beta-propeller fold lactonase family protein [Silvibacterium dinghuense]|uniref:beta-propeller fold lactonase family protein n=1 Tax=Silvibacterium dinghuense TaxID=1560006 RepID=UPI0013E94F59|nr:beta-propeller fold lactonase family protein [Silvibacterium dinghuense]
MKNLPAFSLCVEQAPAWLHLAQRCGNTGLIHTFAATSRATQLLGTSSIEDLAAQATHPTLPILYVARDCALWEHLPRGVVETYAVENSAQPLRLIAQTPMALSSTGPRSIAVSQCGRFLVIASATGRAWNALKLTADGTPEPVASTRKEIGTDVSPHGIAISPRAALAAGVDAGSGRVTLLQLSEEGMAVSARCDTPRGVAALLPAWTPDGQSLIAADRHCTSLSIYALHPLPGENSRIELRDSIALESPVSAILTHAASHGVITLRTDNHGSRLECWRVADQRMQLDASRWLPDCVLSVCASQHEEALWLATEDRLLRWDLRTAHAETAAHLALERGMHSSLTWQRAAIVL